MRRAQFRAELINTPDTAEDLTVHRGRQIRLSVLTETACFAGSQMPNNE